MTYSEVTYYFSKKMFIISSLFIVPGTVILSYFTIHFFREEWLLSLLFAIPLLIFLYILPEYLRTVYFLFSNTPVIILTREGLKDNFNKNEYKWPEIKRIEYKLNEGIKAQGGYTTVYLNDSEYMIRLPDIKLRCKRSDFLETLIDFHNRYKNG